MEQQTFHFHGPSTLNFGQPGHLAEPFTEPVSIKVTPSQKNKLIQDAKEAGYTNLSIFVRDMIRVGWHPRFEELMRELKEMS